MVAGACVIYAAFQRDLLGSIVGMAVIAAGVIEFQGARLLERGRVAGLSWLVNSQLYLLTIILLYVGWRLSSYDPEMLQRVADHAFQSPFVKFQLRSSGISEAEIKSLLESVLPLAYHLTFGLLAFATLVYQGAMVFYYRRRGKILAPALISHVTE